MPFRRLPAWWELLEALRYLTCTLARISSCFYNPCAGKAEKARFCLRWRHREPEAMLDDWARRGLGLLVREEPPLNNRKVVFEHLDYFEKEFYLSKTRYILCFANLKRQVHKISVNISDYLTFIIIIYPIFIYSINLYYLSEWIKFIEKIKLTYLWLRCVLSSSFHKYVSRG